MIEASYEVYWEIGNRYFEYFLFWLYISEN